MSTPTPVHNLPADHKAGRDDEAASKQKKLSDKLDQALEDGFSGSEPVSIIQPSPSAKDKHQT